MSAIIRRAYNLIDAKYEDDDEWDGVLTWGDAQDIATDIILEYGSNVLPLEPEDVILWWDHWRIHSPHIDHVAISRALEYDETVIANLSVKEMNHFAKRLPRYYKNDPEFLSLSESVRERIIAARTS